VSVEELTTSPEGVGWAREHVAHPALRDPGNACRSERNACKATTRIGSILTIGCLLVLAHNPLTCDNARGPPLREQMPGAVSTGRGGLEEHQVGRLHVESLWFCAAPTPFCGSGFSGPLALVARSSPATVRGRGRHRSDRPPATRARRSVAPPPRPGRGDRAHGAPPRTRGLRTGGARLVRLWLHLAETRRVGPGPRA
jgi:hypothetical protein